MVDIFYATVQVVVTYPYMDNYGAIFLEMLTGAVCLLLSYYGVADRFAILIDMIKNKNTTKGQDNIKSISDLLFAHVRVIYETSMEIQTKKTKTKPQEGDQDDLEKGFEESHDKETVEAMGVVWKVLQFMPDMLQPWNEKSTITQEVWV
jgi:hypothetical protein